MNLMPQKRNREQDLFHPLAELHRELDRLFDISLPRFTVSEDPWAPAWGWAPALDVQDHKDHYVVRTELPGLSKDDIHVSLEDNRLTIQGEKKKDTQDKDAAYLRCERFYGKFQRSIVLPAGIAADKVKASFHDGVLELALPKREEDKPKQVRIDVK